MTAAPRLAARPAAARISHDLVQATESLICVVDADGGILLANAALGRFTGRAEAELVGCRLWEVLVIPEEVELARAAIADAMAGGHLLPHEVDWLAAGGVRRRVALHNSVLTDETGLPYATAFVGSDVTEQREREAISQLQASTDALTGVGNRRVLFQALHAHLDLATGGGCGLLFCDVDRFKQVNDQHGHAAGDQLLVELARRLRQEAGAEDVVARLGGDEFVLLVPGSDPAALAALTRRVQRTMGAPVRTTAGPLAMQVSIGTAAGSAGDDPDELMARADLQMYGTKARRNRLRCGSPTGRRSR